MAKHLMTEATYVALVNREHVQAAIHHLGEIMAHPGTGISPGFLQDAGSTLCDYRRKIDSEIQCRATGEIDGLRNLAKVVGEMLDEMDLSAISGHWNKLKRAHAALELED